MNAPTTASLARLRVWLGARAPRERLLLGIAAAVILGAGLLTLAERVSAERARQARSLPTARLAFLAMEQDSLTLAALRERPPPPPTPVAALPDSVRAAAQARGIEAEVRAAGEVLEVRGSTELPALIDWLATLHAEFRLRPRQLELQAADGTGRARFEARFEAAGS